MGYLQINLILFIALICLPLILAGVMFLSAKKDRAKAEHLRKELRVRTADLEQQVERAKSASSAKSDFLSRMSHEIRTPLNAIIGMVQIVRTASEPHKIADYMEKMEDNSKHLLGIINDILDFSKIESGNLILDEKRFSLQRDIDFVISMFQEKASEKDLRLSVELDNIKHDAIVTDKLRLNQVLINLLSNAVKFTDAGGSISLMVEEMVHLDGESVYRFTVEDNGVGIEPEQARKLFTPFTQANASVSHLYGGTGLGLSIAQSIVQMLGGEIGLETKPGQGSTFQFTIRVPAEEAAVDERTSVLLHSPPEKLRGKRILIVDDIDINREIIVALLDGSGALLESANNGKEALDAFCQAQPHWYDLIFMDMLMPVMDGCTATMGIRTSGRPDSQEVKIIAMTANVLPEDMEKAFRAGMDGYLAKPIELELLYTKLEEYL